jgi:RNA polymerase sigma-70 factor (ECF subfamily)
MRWDEFTTACPDLRDGDGALMVIGFTVDAGRITALDVMRNPGKLTTVPDPG